jgi:hypothetical protein
VVWVREMSLGRSFGGGMLDGQRRVHKYIERANRVSAGEAALYARYVLCSRKLLSWWGL